MTRTFKQIPALLYGALLGSAIAYAAVSTQIAGERTSRTVLTHDLPQLDGSRLKADIVEVTYGPSAASPIHSHPCPVIGYVVEGKVRVKIAGQEEAVYKAGETFYEAPNSIHMVSANASDKEKAKFVAFFVCDHNAPLSSPITGDHQ
jgi:quercetin dioxygenase-like cupin family protein